MNPSAFAQRPHFSAVTLGPTTAWNGFTAAVASLPGIQVPGKLFLHEILGLTGMEVSVNCMPAGSKVPFYHAHKTHEELYLFIQGHGQFQVDGEVIEVSPGTAVRVAPDGVRTWRNHSAQDLYYLVIQAPHGGLGAPGTEDGIKIDGKVRWPA